jgi:uncharacterized delta-60 repeat protein
MHERTRPKTNEIDSMKKLSPSTLVFPPAWAALATLRCARLALRRRCFRLFLLLALPCAALAQSPAPDSFNPGEGAEVLAIAVQPDGKIVVGGPFSGLDRINGDGTLDTNFNVVANGPATSLVLQADGKIVVGGEFTTLAGQNRNYIGRLNADGTLDTSFNPGAGGAYGVYCLALQADGKILVGGFFGTLGGQNRDNIGRLNADGTLDTNFNAAVGEYYPEVDALAVQTDGKILVGGQFTTLNGQTRTNFGRLSADGTLDTSFDPGAPVGSVDSLAVQPDGKILVGGFTRLNPDGTVDPSFNPQVSVYARSLALQADGKIVVGGQFTTLAGQSRTNLGRLNTDGTLDVSFNAGATGPYGRVSCLAVQADGKILVGGRFATLGGQSRINIGRLNNTGPATQGLTFDGSTLSWMRGGSTPEVWRTRFEYSSNGASWTNLGTGTRIPGGWQLTGLAIPIDATVRARGFVASSASSWFVEQTLAVAQTPPVILVHDPDFGVRSNQFGFNTHALSGQAVVIETSTDFVTWTPLQTNLVTGSGVFFFTDAQSGRFPRRFYRARLQ